MTTSACDRWPGNECAIQPGERRGREQLARENRLCASRCIAVLHGARPASAPANCRRAAAATRPWPCNAGVASLHLQIGRRHQQLLRGALPVQRGLAVPSDRSAGETAPASENTAAWRVDGHVARRSRAGERCRSSRAGPVHGRRARSRRREISPGPAAQGIAGRARARVARAYPIHSPVGAISRSRSRMSFCGKSPASGSSVSARR